MENQYLHQTLLVDPDVPFADIESAMESIGWSRSDGGLATPPLIAGEPELASWSWHGQKPLAVYTFNPVARLRVLDVGTAPPALRGEIARRLPLLEPNRLGELFQAKDARGKLLALWAAQELELVELLPEARGLQDDSEAVVGEQATSVVSRLEKISQARLEVLASLRQLCEQAAPMIAGLSDPEFVRGLRPSRDDCAALFDEPLADGILAGIGRLYDNGLQADPLAADEELKITAAPASLLRFPNELSNRFPSAYRTLAGWMNPEHIWLSWEVRSPSGGCTQYDGLAWQTDHWVWLPKVYRTVAVGSLSTNSEPSGSNEPLN